MPIYEHVFLARQDVTDQQVETMVKTYRGVIEANGGKVEKIEMWGVKSLAYRIKKNRKAHFTLLNIDAPETAVAEMERQMQISEDVLRFMTVRVEELESASSAMLHKTDHDSSDRSRHRDKIFRGVVSESSYLSESRFGSHEPEALYSGLKDFSFAEGNDIVLGTQYDLILSQLRSLNDVIEKRLGGQEVHERGSIQRNQERNTNIGGSEPSQGQHK